MLNLRDKEFFSGQGRVYLNAAGTQAPGEKYILNQQLSSIKYASDIHFSRSFHFHSLLIYNSSPNPVNPAFYFDEAFFEFKKPKSPFKVVLGKSWIPFAKNKSNLIYKPLTKALGQTNEVSLEIGHKQDVYLKALVFEPHTKITGSALPVYYNLNAGIQNERNAFKYDIGVSYLYSLAESQLFQYNKGFGGFLGKSIKSHVPGVMLNTRVEYKKLFADFTYVSAAQIFSPSEISYQNKGAKPAAFSFQWGYQFEAARIPLQAIIFYDRSFQALALKLPKQRVGIGLNLIPHPKLNIQFQISRDSNYHEGTVASGFEKILKGDSKKTNVIALQGVLYF